LVFLVENDTPDGFWLFHAFPMASETPLYLSSIHGYLDIININHGTSHVIAPLYKHFVNAPHKPSKLEGAIFTTPGGKHLEPIPGAVG